MIQSLVKKPERMFWFKGKRKKRFMFGTHVFGTLLAFWRFYHQSNENMEAKTIWLLSFQWKIQLLIIFNRYKTVPAGLVRLNSTQSGPNDNKLFIIDKQMYNRLYSTSNNIEHSYHIDRIWKKSRVLMAPWRKWSCYNFGSVIF